MGVSRRREPRDRRAPQTPEADRRPGDGRAESGVDRIDLQRALLTLPPRQREVLVLRYLLDLPEADVANELGLRIGTVKTHAHRALTAMRIAMSDEGTPTKEICDV